MPVKLPYVLHVFVPRVQVVLPAFAVTPVWHPSDSGPGSRIFTSLMKGSDRPGGAGNGVLLFFRLVGLAWLSVRQPRVPFFEDQFLNSSWSASGRTVRR